MYIQSCVVFYKNSNKSLEVLTVIMVNCQSLLTLQNESDLLDAYAKKYAFDRQKLSCISSSTITDPR